MAAAIVVMSPPSMWACTSAIIPGWAVPDGRPLLWKHRDTGTLENSVRHFKGEKYSFTGLVNSSSQGGEVWIGSNTAGFAIMNTASYCLNDDDVPPSDMDREGILMYRALEICATVADFAHFLDTLRRPMGVEANFGCIDAYGGAAYFETGNYGYNLRDVSVMPEGYCVVTNFSISGRKEDWKGYERYLTADRILNRMKGGSRSFTRMGPSVIMDSLSRSYGHAVLGLDLVRDSAAFLSMSGGIAVDQDFIPRRSTSASVVVQGARAGETDAFPVMWTAIGYPACAVMIPVPVTDSDHVPPCLKGRCCEACMLSLGIKGRWIFRFGQMSNLGCYMDMVPVLKGCSGMPPLLECSAAAEAVIRGRFGMLQGLLEDGGAGEEAFFEEYDRLASDLPGIMQSFYGGYVQGVPWPEQQSNFAVLSKNP